jgi:hypothetical protein
MSRNESLLSGWPPESRGLLAAVEDVEEAVEVVEADGEDEDGLEMLESPKENRCYYDHNFRRFSPIFGEKIGVILKNECYDQIFAKTSRSLSKLKPLRKYF